MDYEALLAALNRIRAGDFTAFDDLHELAVAELVTEITPEFPRIDQDDIYDAIADTFIRLWKDPSCCHATTGRIAFAFLQVSVRRRILNAIRKAKCRSKHETRAVVEAGDVALFSPDVSTDEEQEVELQARVANLEHRLRDPRDREILRLQLSGERDTAVFARVLGVDRLSVSEQRAEVKRVKDRIMAFLRRKVRRA